MNEAIESDQKWVGKTAVWEKAWEGGGERAGRAPAWLALLPLRGDCAAVPTSVSPAPVCSVPPLLIPWLWLSSPRSTPAPHTALVGSRHGAEAGRAGGGLQAPCSRSSLAFSSSVLFFLLGDSGYTEQNSRSDSSLSLPDLK